MMEWTIWVLTGLLVAMTLVPVSRISHGFVRVMSFPRQQIILIAVVLAIIAPFALSGQGLWLTLAALAGVLAFQMFYIARFFPFMRKQTLDVGEELGVDTSRHISVMASNVKLSNRKYHLLLDLVEQVDPDVLMVVEIDDRWLEALAPLRERYAHVEARPLDNGYGMAMFSKHPLLDAEWREVLIEKVPSLKVRIELNGDPIRLYMIHPEPPVPNHSTDGRDAEIGLVGIEAHEDPLPAIVAGDLNDVAWSHTTRRFQRLSGLLDPRVGRGFFNTFHAGVPIWRWPLDHLFHDPRFRLIEMRRLPSVGSDHYPVLFRLALTAVEASDEEVEEACEEDREEIETMAREERKNPREAIGSHWEDED